MDRVDLTYRLRKLGMKKGDLAKRMGLAADTIYQWGEVPQYAVALVEALENIARLEGVKPREVSAPDRGRPKHPGRPENLIKARKK